MSTIQIPTRQQNKGNAEEILLHRILAHEMKNNLDLIKTGVMNLRNGAVMQPENSLELLENASSTLEELFNVLQSGYFSPNYRVTDLSDLILQQLSMLESGTREHGIDLNFKFYDDDIHIYADGSQLGRSLFNLIKNAIEACEPGDSITVEAWSSSRSAQIKITDTGKGMESETLHYMWKPFFTTKKDKSKSHGLGTYIARTTVHNHKGTIYAESRICSGTTIHISLPMSCSPLIAA